MKCLCGSEERVKYHCYSADAEGCMEHDRVRLLLAWVCVRCPLCRRARRTQRGLAFRLVRLAEERACVFCRAYEKVYGRRPHEPLP